MPYTFHRSGNKIVGTKRGGGKVYFHTTKISVARKRAQLREWYKHRGKS